MGKRSDILRFVLDMIFLITSQQKNRDNHGISAIDSLSLLGRLLTTKS